MKEYYCEKGQIYSKDLACAPGKECVEGACVESACEDSDDGKDTSLKSEKIGRVYAYTMGDFDEALGSAGLSRGDIELFMDRV